MSEVCARAKIEPAVGFHQMRHTYASHCVMNGVPLMIVAKNCSATPTRACVKSTTRIWHRHTSPMQSALARRDSHQPHVKVVPLTKTDCPGPQNRAIRRLHWKAR